VAVGATPEEHHTQAGVRRSRTLTVGACICRVRTAKEGDNIDAIKDTTEALSKAVQKIGEHMSAQGAAKGGEPSDGDSTGNKASGG
jgi:hypothetical protein